MTPTDLKQIRLDLGLTQTEFGEKLGVTYGTVCRWENGKYAISERTAMVVRMLRDGLV